MRDMEVKTPYEWCIEANIRLLDINEWPLKWHGSSERHFFEFPTMVKSEFLELLEVCHVKPNSLQRKTEMYLEYRMYGLVPYNLSPIQQGIQYGHGVVEYRETIEGINNFLNIYKKWAKVDKTFIILNGGTTNNNPERLGTLNIHMNTLRENGVQVQDFYEPDLNDALTAVVFLVDERVFNRELYPDFIKETLPWSRQRPSEKRFAELEKRNAKNYEHWLEKIGGAKNAFLRDYLRGLKLA